MAVRAERISQSLTVVGFVGETPGTVNLVLDRMLRRLVVSSSWRQSLPRWWSINTADDDIDVTDQDADWGNFDVTMV